MLRFMYVNIGLYNYVKSQDWLVIVNNVSIYGENALVYLN